MNTNFRSLRKWCLCLGCGFSLALHTGCQPADTSSDEAETSSEEDLGIKIELPTEDSGEEAEDEATRPASDETSSAGSSNDAAAEVTTAVDTTAATDWTPDSVEVTSIELLATDAPAESNVTSELQVAPATSGQVVMLGTPDLTAGLPGQGPLAVEEVRAWLDRPANHQALQVRLPLGLSAAEANITGLDENPMTRAKIELGRQLYFDTRLSKDGTISCASCHHPDEGYARRTTFGEGIDGQTGNRNSPVAYNRIVSDAQFWDGRAASLEAQAVGPIANPIEMGHTHADAVATVESIEGYRIQFEKIFGDEGVTIDNIGKAIATFERAIVTAPAPYDHLEFVQGVEKQWAGEIDVLEEEDPELYARYQDASQRIANLSESAIRGRGLFFSEKANCTACHAGANFADEEYHNLGVGMEAEEPDLGRFSETQADINRGAFKTPTMRNVALSAPYMHDGSQETLEDVVEWYAKGGHPNPYLSEKVKKLDLTDQDKADLVAFMKEALTSDFPPVETGRLPQ